MNGFWAPSPCRTCASRYQRCSNSCAATPTLTPNPSPAPPGGKGGPTALCGRVLEVVEFTVSRQLSKWLLTAGWGRVFKGAAPTLKVNAGSGSVGRAHVVPGTFECWPLGVNATPHTALAEYGCWLPFPPQRGWRGVGGEGGNEQGVEVSATCFRKAFEEVLSRQPLPDLREQLPKM